MKRIALILLFLIAACMPGCTSHRIAQIKSAMLRDFEIMKQNPETAQAHTDARYRFNQHAEQLVDLGHFQKEVIELHHIRSGTPEANALLLDLQPLHNPLERPSELVWTTIFGQTPEHITIWDTPEYVPKWKAIIKTHDIQQ